MEHLVFTYHGGDGYTYSYTDHIPFEYESKAKAENDFFEIAYDALKKHIGRDENYWKGIEFFRGYAHGFDVMQFFQPDPTKEKLMKYENIDRWEYHPPTILTLEEWFDANKEYTLNYAQPKNLSKDG